MKKPEELGIENNYKVIESLKDMDRFYSESRDVEWMAFDTEFIPEKYYWNKLCVISVATPRGNYLIDAMKIKKMGKFLRLVEDPRILKITHAGENDYQILVAEYNARPLNIFDTQLTYGFLSRDYPLGLQFLVERELKVKMNKGELKSDWEKRPLTPQQMAYAVNDVIYLYPLMKALKRKLKRRQKYDWAMEENQRWEQPGYFTGESTDFADFLNSVSMRGLNRKQKMFLLRLHRWRHDEAKRRNIPLNSVLKTRVINTIVRAIGADTAKESLLKDRTIPDGIIHHHWPMFSKFFNKRSTHDEADMLSNIPEEENGNPREAIALEILYQVLRLKAVEHKIAPNLILSKRELNKMKSDSGYYPLSLDEGWREEVLGTDLMQWIKSRKPLEISVEANKCILTLQEGEDLGAAFTPGSARRRRGFFRRLCKKLAGKS